MFVTNSIKKKPSKTSKGSFNLAKFEGGLKGWLLRVGAITKPQAV